MPYEDGANTLRPTYFDSQSILHSVVVCDPIDVLVPNPKIGTGKIAEPIPVGHPVTGEVDGALELLHHNYVIAYAGKWHTCSDGQIQQVLFHRETYDETNA